MKRVIFYISDRTGITAETLGHSLITQFEPVEFEHITIPYVDTPEKAQTVVNQINETTARSEGHAIVFATIINTEIRKIIATSNGVLMDFFNTFIGPLEKELGLQSSHSIGRSHGMIDYESYKTRIDAVNYALTADDGANLHNYDLADVIILGVSRCGKTPTSLYLAMQFGIRAANYPFTADDMESLSLPSHIKPYKDKCFGLTIDPRRLQAIRNIRRPESEYASRRQCEREIREVLNLYKKERIPYLDTSSNSIEEIATKLMASLGLTRRLC